MDFRGWIVFGLADPQILKSKNLQDWILLDFSLHEEICSESQLNIC